MLRGWLAEQGPRPNRSPPPTALPSRRGPGAQRVQNGAPAPSHGGSHIPTLTLGLTSYGAPTGWRKAAIAPQTRA